MQFFGSVLRSALNLLRALSYFQLSSYQRQLSLLHDTVQAAKCHTRIQAIISAYNY